MMTAPLRIHEMYRSIQGEGRRAGLPCTFVRLSGCDLRCSWCDTPEAFAGGEVLSIDAVLERVETLGADLVLVTGGEPLLQPAALTLMAALADQQATVLLETGGHRPIDRVDPRVEIIMDLKCPGSGEVAKNVWANLEVLKPKDQIKFVLADRADYDWARATVSRYDLARQHIVTFSPVHGVLDAALLSNWILTDRLTVHLGLQLHKYIWSPSATGV